MYSWEILAGAIEEVPFQGWFYTFPCNLVPCIIMIRGDCVPIEGSVVSHVCKHFVIQSVYNIALIESTFMILMVVRREHNQCDRTHGVCGILLGDG